MERAVLLGEGGVLEPKDLALLPTREQTGEFEVTFPPGGIVWADLEKSLVEQALRQSGGNQVRAAKLLGLSRDALRYRMEKYGVSS
jgi:two-component system NtrC family response regulator